MQEIYESIFDMHKFGGLREDEYIKDNMIYCKKCHGKRLSVLPDWRGGNKPTIVRCVCQCQEEAQQEKARQEKLKEEHAKFKQLQEASLLGERYHNVTFANTDLKRDDSFVTAFNRCKKFCENRQIVLEKGYGMYLWGSSGGGKTHLMACMVNELSMNYMPCLFTNFFEIAKQIKKTFSRSLYSESDFVNQLTNIPFLFIDDFGTERVQKEGEDTWLQEKIYDVVNKRYNTQKPTIFSSNLSVIELSAKQGIMPKTVDRVIEMSSAVIKIEGDSYRFIKRDKEIPF